MLISYIINLSLSLPRRFLCNAIELQELNFVFISRTFGYLDKAVPRGQETFFRNAVQSPELKTIKQQFHLKKKLQLGKGTVNWTDTLFYLELAESTFFLLQNAVLSPEIATTLNGHYKCSSITNA